MTGETIGLGRSFGRGKQGGVRGAVPLPDLLIDTTGLTEIPNRTAQAGWKTANGIKSRSCPAQVGRGIDVRSPLTDSLDDGRTLVSPLGDRIGFSADGVRWQGGTVVGKRKD